jgi:hypothetical protein
VLGALVENLKINAKRIYNMILNRRTASRVSIYTNPNEESIIMAMIIA